MVMYHSSYFKCQEKEEKFELILSCLTIIITIIVSYQCTSNLFQALQLNKVNSSTHSASSSQALQVKIKVRDSQISIIKVSIDLKNLTVIEMELL